MKNHVYAVLIASLFIIYKNIKFFKPINLIPSNLYSTILQINIFTDPFVIKQKI